MRRAIRAATAALLVGGVAQAQIQIQPLPVQIQPGGGFVGKPGRPVEYTGPTASQKALNSQLVVSGTVTMEKETADVAMYPGQPVKTTYRVATIKVADTLVGDKAEKVKVLIAPGDPTWVNDAPSGAPPQPYFPQFPNSIQLIDGQEGVFFLTAHPTAKDQWMVSQGNPPLNPLDTKYKDDLAAVKAVAAVYADPVKALKAEKAEDKMRAAAVLVSKYRRFPQNFQGPGQPEQKAIPAEEAKLIFQAMLDADWEKWDKPQNDPNIDWTLNPSNLLSQMQVYPGGQKGQGGNFPQVRPQPGQGYNAAYKEAFKSWLEADGKDFEIKRFVQAGEKGSGKKDEPKKELPKK